VIIDMKLYILFVALYLENQITSRYNYVTGMHRTDHLLGKQTFISDVMYMLKDMKQVYVNKLRGVRTCTE